MNVAAYSALPMGPWMAAHWLFVVATVVVAGGLTAFTRHFAHTDGEGWSTSLSAFGLAMLRDAAWPRWLGQVGIVIGLALVVIDFTVESFTIFKIAFAIGYLWLAIAGFLFARFAGLRPGQRPGVTAPPDAYKPSAGVPAR